MEQIFDRIKETLEPIGVGVFIESPYIYMMIMDLKINKSNTTYSCLRESFKERDTRNEFLKLLNSK